MRKEEGGLLVCAALWKKARITLEFLPHTIVFSRMDRAKGQQYC